MSHVKVHSAMKDSLKNLKLREGLYAAITFVFLEQLWVTISWIPVNI